MIDDERRRLDLDMARLADGDRSVFQGVFRTLWPIVRGVCARAVPESDADDAAQQAMEKILSRACDYDPARPALPWVLAIAAWECRTVRQRGTRRREDELSAELPSSGTSPEDAAVLSQLVDAVRAVVGQLSLVDQQALESAYSDESERHVDVAGATLRKRRERALRRLRDAWRRLHGG